MIEPGDVTMVGFTPDSTPLPFNPEPGSKIYQGKPDFLGRYNEITQVPVHGMYEMDVRIRGNREIEVTFDERDLFRSGSWSFIKSVKLRSGYIGFRVEFPIRQGYAGQHQLRFTARNSSGKAFLFQTLKVIQRQTGG